MQQSEDRQDIAPQDCLYVRVPQQWATLCKALLCFSK